MVQNNQNSLFNKYSRYVGGGTAEISGNKIEWWSKTIFNSDPTDINYKVEKLYVGRLDLISSVFYNEPRYWWVIAQYNNILNPTAEIKEGKTLLIPTKSRLHLMLSTKTGGIESTRQPISTISPTVI